MEIFYKGYKFYWFFFKVFKLNVWCVGNIVLRWWLIKNSKLLVEFLVFLRVFICMNK